MRIVTALAVALVVANHASPVQAGERPAKAKWIYDIVMDWVADYGSLSEPKVMAICIDWDASTASGIYIHNAFINYTDIGSDAPIFAGNLAHDAKYRCRKWSQSENIDCTCQMLDSNGKNVLEVPPRN